MSDMSTVWFMVDDTDPRLNYSGDWSLVPSARINDFDHESSSGATYNSTLHSTTGNVTFRFNGSSYLGVYGTQQVFAPSNGPPVISCFVDGEMTWSFIDSSSPLGVSNNVLACRADSAKGGSSPGEHELLINFTVQPNSTWYLDYITFESLTDPVLDGEVLQAGNGEVIESTNYSMLTFGAGWTGDVDNSTETDIPFSTATMKFNGTSMTLFGNLVGNDTLNNLNTAAYQVDEADPVVFRIFPTSSLNSSNQPLFTASISPGEHTVTVAFNGSQSGPPLDISYFLVTSLTQVEQAALLTQRLSATGHTKILIIEAILGSVIPVIFLVILGSIIWLRRRRRGSRGLALLAPEPFAFQQLDNSRQPPLSKRSIKTVLNTIEPRFLTVHQHTRSVDQENVRTMKLEQRVVVLQEQAQRAARAGALVIQDHVNVGHIHSLPAEGPIIHTDSGLRLMGDSEVEREEVPPGYTAD